MLCMEEVAKKKNQKKKKSTEGKKKKKNHKIICVAEICTEVTVLTSYPRPSARVCVYVCWHILVCHAGRELLVQGKEES